jgi:hypothetical protein
MLLLLLMLLQLFMLLPTRPVESARDKAAAC